jgi:PH domain
MAQALRQRRLANTASGNSDQNMPANRHGLNLNSMQAASPQHTGCVMKLHVPLLYSILPRFLQKSLKRVISKVSILSCMLPLMPRWKPRQLVLLGSFIYKFAEDQGIPKGSPVPLSSLDIQLILDTDWMLLDLDIDFPPGYTAMFCISNLRKKYYFACTNIDEARTWVNSLTQAKQESFTRSMGHAPQDSYPPKWKYYDSLGRSFMKSKERIQLKMEQHNLHEMELIGLSGGPMPRGYYG